MTAFEDDAIDARRHYNQSAPVAAPTETAVNAFGLTHSPKEAKSESFRLAPLLDSDREYLRRCTGSVRPVGPVVFGVDAQGEAVTAYVFALDGTLIKGGNRLAVESFNAARHLAGFPPVAQWQMEFPDFAAADMPVLPAGFEDESWHNDSCPHFENRALRLAVWTDFADPAEREFEESSRFAVYAIDEGGGHMADLPDLATDEWAEVQAFILAAQFAADLKAELTPEQWETMRQRNVSYDESACASHDFCDANMIMEPAFAKVTGREAGGTWETHYDAATGQHVADDPAEEARAMADMAIWNAAWGIAKRRYLTAEPVADSWGSPALDSLAAMFADWTGREGFGDDADAAELLMTADLTAPQRAWLESFVTLWTDAQAAADAESV